MFEVLLGLLVVCYLLVKFLSGHSVPVEKECNTITVPIIDEASIKKKKAKKVSFCEYDEEFETEVEYDRSGAFDEDILVLSEVKVLDSFRRSSSMARESNFNIPRR